MTGAEAAPFFRQKSPFANTSMHPQNQGRPAFLPLLAASCAASGPRAAERLRPPSFPGANLRIARRKYPRKSIPQTNEQ